MEKFLNQSMKPGEIKSIKDAGDIKGKRVVLRLDLNVPIKDGAVVDDFRIKKIVPTLEFLSKAKAKTVVLSHIESGRKTLRPVCDYLAESFKVFFAGSVAEAVPLSESLGEGNFVLVENIRNEEGEVANHDDLAKKLAALGDLYVNEAFSASHREHASIVGIPKYLPSYAGLLFANEVKNLSAALKPESPSLFILGGAKFETKFPLLRKLGEIYDSTFVGGGLVRDFLAARDTISQDNFYLPTDVIVRREISEEINLKDLKNSEVAVDCGTKTTELLKTLVEQSKFVLWNGTLGVCEEGFCQGTVSLIKILVKSGARVYAGGGDTVSEIDKAGALDKFTFVSTGGGAMLEFLAEGTLPGIEILKN